MTVTIARVSLDQKNFLQGGLIDDVDVEILDARWTMYDYGGNAVLALALGVQMRVMGAADPEKATYDQYYSAGDKEFFRPSTPEEDGTANGGGLLVPIGNRAGLNQNTNAAQFLASMQNSQFPVERLETLTITEALAGSVLHVNRVAQQKRPGLIKTGNSAGGGEREKTILLVTRVISLPGQKAAVAVVAGGVAGKPTMTTKTAPAPVAAQPIAVAAKANGSAAVVDAELDGVCQETLVGILTAKGGQVAKKELPALAFQALKAHPRKKEAVPRIFSDTFLSSINGMPVEHGGQLKEIGFDGATVTLA